MRFGRMQLSEHYAFQWRTRRLTIATKSITLGL